MPVVYIQVEGGNVISVHTDLEGDIDVEIINFDNAKSDGTKAEAEETAAKVEEIYRSIY